MQRGINSPPSEKCVNHKYVGTRVLGLLNRGSLSDLAVDTLLDGPPGVPLIVSPTSSSSGSDIQVGTDLGGDRALPLLTCASLTNSESPVFQVVALLLNPAVSGSTEAQVLVAVLISKPGSVLHVPVGCAKRSPVELRLRSTVRCLSGWFFPTIQPTSTVNTPLCLIRNVLATVLALDLSFYNVI